MSPTTSSMAKISRSVSMGDNLNVVEQGEDTGSSDPRRSSGFDCSNPQSSSQSKPTTPVTHVSSFNTLASPFPGPYTPHAAVIPTLSAGPTGNSSSKGLQVKLTGSARPLLHIDIPNPLPDKLSLSSLSPGSKSPNLVQKEKDSLSRTPTTPPSLPGAVHLPNSIVQPVTAVGLSPDQIELSMVLTPSQTTNLTEAELHSHTEPEEEDIPEAECSPMSQCSTSLLQSSSGAQDSGLLGHQSSLIPSSILLRLGLSKHLFTKGLWPRSSSTSSITSFISSSPSSSINHYHLQGEACPY